MIQVSFSWDDGTIYDLRLAKLFEKYDMNAMFFIPTTNWEQSYILKEMIKELYDMGMEIGGHTTSHKYLTTIPSQNIENEIKDNKFYLENIIQDKVDIFCYPGGFYDANIENIVKKYFKRARSAKTMRFHSQDSFTVDTSFHFYDRGIKSLLKNCFQNDLGMFPTVMSSLSSNTFITYRRIMQKLLLQDEIFNIHIWGHGWEIEQYNLWNELENLLKFIKNCPTIQIISNKAMYCE